MIVANSGFWGLLQFFLSRYSQCTACANFVRIGFSRFWGCQARAFKGLNIQKLYECPRNPKLLTCEYKPRSIRSMVWWSYRMERERLARKIVNSEIYPGPKYHKVGQVAVLWCMWTRTQSQHDCMSIKIFFCSNRSYSWYKLQIMSSRPIPIQP